MVDFPQRLEPSRRSTREIIGGREYDAAILDDWPTLIRPVTGQQSASDSALSGENLDYLITQFIARLRTPGAQISAPTLQSLVVAVTEMVSALSQGTAPSQPQNQQAPTVYTLPKPQPEQPWTPSLGEQPPVYSSRPFTAYSQANSDIINRNEYGTGDSSAAYTAEGYAANELEWGQQSPMDSAAAVNGYSSDWNSEKFAYSEQRFIAPQNNTIYFPQSETVARYNNQEIPASPEDDKLAPIQGIKREFVPQGIPLAFFASEEGEEDMEAAPTLFDFIQSMETDASTDAFAL